MDFTGKVVIMTGASSGIGAATAVLFAQHNAKLVIVGRNQQRLGKIAEKCQTAKGIEPLSLQYDLTEKGSCEAIVSKTVAAFGRIDVLVNCAGKFVISSLLDENIDAFDEVIDLNLRVPVKLTHLALPHLVKTRGNVVNIIAAKYMRVRHGFIPYSVAKAGLDRFTKSAAVELATEGVRVNSVQPGVVRTNILSNIAVDEDVRDSVFQTLTLDRPNIRVIEPEEVAKMVVFVASDLCPNINGADMGIHSAVE